MKVTNNQLRVAVLILAAVLILYGLFKMFFKFTLGEFIDHNLPNAIMIAVAGIFLWNRQIWANQKKREAEEAARKDAEASPQQE